MAEVHLSAQELTSKVTSSCSGIKKQNKDKEEFLPERLRTIRSGEIEQVGKSFSSVLSQKNRQSTISADKHTQWPLFYQPCTGACEKLRLGNQVLKYFSCLIPSLSLINLFEISWLTSWENNFATCLESRLSKQAAWDQILALLLVTVRMEDLQHYEPQFPLFMKWMLTEPAPWDHDEN